MKTTHKKQITSAQKIMRRRFEGGSPERIAEREKTGREMALGMKIRQLREEAGWTQQQLAKKIGTQPSAISRIEDADYDSHYPGAGRRGAGPRTGHRLPAEARTRRGGLWCGYAGGIVS
jgi:DNA-binding XRE family transcriptional regulator